MKYRNGFLIHRRYETGLTASSQFALTPPRPRPEDETGIDYDTEGRIDGALLANLIRNDDAHYYLCGQTRFMADLQTDLERRDIPSEYIHTETFGPVG